MAYYNNMMAGPAGGQAAWQQAQSPATTLGLQNSSVGMQQMLAETTQSTTLQNATTMAMGRWTRMEQMAAFVASVNRMAQKFSQSVSDNLMDNANRAIQSMSK